MSQQYCSICNAGSHLVQGPGWSLCNACITRTFLAVVYQGHTDVQQLSPVNSHEQVMCSFCGYTHQQIAWMIELTPQVAICNICLELCVDKLLSSSTHLATSKVWKLEVSERDKRAALYPGVDFVGDVTLATGVSIGVNSKICNGVTLGANVQIGHHVCIQHGCCIGAGTIIGDYAFVDVGCHIGEQVVIGEKAIIGFRNIIPPGTTVPPDGWIVARYV